MPEQTSVVVCPEARLGRADYEIQRFQADRRGRRLNQRERWWVDRFLGSLPNGSTVLDVPAGTGRFTDLISRHGHRAVSIDLAFARIREAAWRDGAKPFIAVQGDILHLPLADDSVDAALCVRLFHHLTPVQIEAVLSELCRVARSAYVTFYSRFTVKFYKKRLRGKTPSGRYYSCAEIARLGFQAGWRVGRHEPAFDPLHNLHFVRFER